VCAYDAPQLLFPPDPLVLPDLALLSVDMCVR
jgi:hypothetical protein